MSVTVYVEGGGGNHATQVRCREGFAKYCSKLCPVSGCFKIVACGSRGAAFKKFETAVGSSKPNETCALLVDSEGPVVTDIRPAVYLLKLDKWKCPDLRHHRLFLMVQAMEAWFFADRMSLAKFYGQGFRPGSLPYTEQDIEAIPKDDLVPSLNQAVAGTSKKRYHKMDHSFAILAAIDPHNVAAGSPHAAAFNSFINSLVP